MHFSAKRGHAIACHPSICLSMTLVDCDHIGWNSSKKISRLVSLGCSLSADPNITKRAVGWLVMRKIQMVGLGRLTTDEERFLYDTSYYRIAFLVLWLGLTLCMISSWLLSKRNDLKMSLNVIGINIIQSQCKIMLAILYNVSCNTLVYSRKFFYTSPMFNDSDRSSPFCGILRQFLKKN